MWQKRWVQWLLVLLGIASAHAIVYMLLSSVDLPTAFIWSTSLFGPLESLWLFYGLWRWRDRRWVQQATWIVISGYVAGLIGWICQANGSKAGAIAIIGMWAMVGGFVLGLALIRLILWPAMGKLGPIFGVARTLIDEAIRMKVVLIFGVALMLLVPILPLVLDEKERLAYRVETFLIWSMTSMTVLLGALSIFLACGTICNEISRKWIFTTMTKPISRGEYLLGKWVGIALLNALLVTVAGGGVWVFARVLQEGQARHLQDRVEVDLHVLVARDVRTPTPLQDGALAKRFDTRLEELRKIDPLTYQDPLDDRVREQLEMIIKSNWYTIDPMRAGTYKFTGLQAVREKNVIVQLRLRPRLSRATPDGLVRVAMRLNGRLWPIKPLADEVAHVLDLPIEAIDDNGQLIVEIANVTPPAYHAKLILELDDGITLMYVAGSFEGNLARALLVIWTRLCFLAMLGLAAGTFLGFPTACLACLVLWIIASTSAYLTESLNMFVGTTFEQQDWFETIANVITGFGLSIYNGEFEVATRMFLKLLGTATVLAAPALSDYDAVSLVADGRAVPTKMIVGALLWIGVVWTGGTGVFAWFIFKRRELAGVTV